jgi:hypothetical protein
MGGLIHIRFRTFLITRPRFILELCIFPANLDGRVEQRVRRKSPPATKVGPVINDRQSSTSFYATDDSPPRGDPFALRVLVLISRWDYFKDPPQRVFEQRICDWLHSILNILFCSVLARGSGSPLRRGNRLSLPNVGGDIPPGECIIVPQNPGIRTHDLLDHPAKWNISESMLCSVRCITPADI